MTRIVTLTLNPALDLSTEADQIVPDLKLRCAAPRAHAGGGGVNVSRAIAYLGGKSTAALALGGDAGERVRKLLRAEDISVQDLGVHAPTRENFSVMSRHTGQQFRFVMPGGVWAAQDMETASKTICDVVAPGDIIVPSGSLPPGLEPADLMDLADRVSLQGGRVVLDTSGPALQAATQARSTPLEVLRMDLEEAQSISGQGLRNVADVADFARALCASGSARSVIVAKGAEGSILATADAAAWHVRPPHVKVLSKIGAGDSFVAGFTLAVARGKSLLDAVVQGVGAAASTVTSPDTDLCTAQDAARYAAQSTVTAV